jgi:glyoxalase family protein
VIALEDPDGLQLELVTDARAAALPGWTAAGDAAGDAAVPAEHAVRGVRGVTLWVAAPERTAGVLEGPLGMRRAAADGDRARYETADPDAVLGRTVDVRAVGPEAARGRMGAGTVHHVAFRTGDDAGELALRAAVTDAGLSATPQIDRQYFRSVYFREPGGVLFELATDAPGLPGRRGARRARRRPAAPAAVRGAARRDRAPAAAADPSGAHAVRTHAALAEVAA